MIIDVWKPVILKKQIQYYELCNINQLTIHQKKGYKVRYTCDICNSSQIFNTTSTSLLKSKWNNTHKQMCRSCRTIKSEKEVKQTVITYDKFKKVLYNEGYSLLTTKKEFDSSKYPSQIKVNVKCNKGHITTTIWNNFVNHNKRCRKCYEKSRFNKHLPGFFMYKRLVQNYSNRQYTKYKYIINPDNLLRKQNKYHLDHKFSISEGFKNNIPIWIIGDVTNLQMLSEKDNCSKNSKCSITKRKLLNEFYR